MLSIAPNLINWGPLDRAIHRPVVSWDLACPLCGVVPNDPYPFEPKDQCPHLVSFVRDISVQDILKRIYALFPGLCMRNFSVPFPAILPMKK